MRIAPNPRPVVRVRNTLMTAAALVGVWLLLGLAACATPPAAPAAAKDPPTADRSTFGSRATITRFAPAGPIPLASPRTPLRDWSRARA